MIISAGPLKLAAINKNFLDELFPHNYIVTGFNLHELTLFFVLLAVCVLCVWIALYIEVIE